MKFKLIKNEHFFEHLISLGIPEEHARIANSSKPTLGIQIQDPHITFTSSTAHGSEPLVSVLVFNQEIEENIMNIIVKSTTYMKNNIITILSTGPNGEKGTRVFEFFNNNLLLTLSNENSNVPVARRYYERIE